MVGTLVAIAHKDGLLDSFDHPVLDFFADRSIADLIESAAKLADCRIYLAQVSRHLLVR